MDAYEKSGVNYGAMDPFKRLCQMRAAKTERNAIYLGIKGFTRSRGESAFTLDMGRSHRQFLGFVDEGLGTKNKVADAMDILAPTPDLSWYFGIAHDTVAMAVNDLLTGAFFPTAVSMHLAAGHEDWFKNEWRNRSLVEGWGDACDRAMCVWGPGETSTLKGIVYPDSVVLSAATVGVQYQHRLVLSGDLSEGDVIMFLGSSGIHANGLTLAREIADELPEGYLTKLPDGSLYGEALLAPTHIYVRFLRACVEAGVRFSYIVNITGHGWRKLMRANEDFSYIIHTLPTEQPLFRFMQEWRNLPDREMYGNLNMGAGFALYVREGDVATVRRVAAEKIYGFDVFPAGVVAAPGPGGKRVVIEPLDGLIFEKEELEVR